MFVDNASLFVICKMVIDPKFLIVEVVFRVVGLRSDLQMLFGP